ncbi:MAG: NAD/NADP octopine/nopaline dehydrogenase family protein [Bacteroidales bacterium]|nr:NAD/NADP octopine/nopaline dehydrogenase family protein [Bacteroidales bacterium]
MKVTIIGCGNAGMVHAAKLIERHVPVCLLKTSTVSQTEFFRSMMEVGGFNVIDETQKGKHFFAKPDLITRNVEQAVSFADVIMVMTTTSQHESVAKAIAPYVRDGQIIALVPGYMGSLIFKKYIQKEVCYSEWETTAYNGRIVDQLYVHVTFYNPRNAISVLPVAATQQVLSVFSQMFDNTRYTRKHILESAIHNPNMIVHPIGIVFSASRIEHSGGEFWMYKEAFTDSVVHVIHAFDRQKNNLLQAFGCEPLNYFEAAKWRNEEDLTIDAMEVFRSFSNAANKGPSTIHHRYLTEDVPVGLGLYTSIGRVAGVDTSIADAIITLSSALIEKDLRQEARTIEYLLGKEKVTPQDIVLALEK